MLHGFARELLGQTTSLSAETRDRLSNLQTQERHYSPRDVLYRPGDSTNYIHVARSGWFATGIDLRNGGRQLLNYYVPVDIMGLEFLSFDEAPTALFALCEAEALLIQREAFLEIMDSDPSLMRQMLSILGLQDVLMQERLCAMSRMNARDKIAYFLLLLRSKVNDKSDSGSGSSDLTMRFPLNQTDIADSLGLTNVTVSRTLTELEKAGFLRYARNRVEFLNVEGLAKSVAFHDRYAKFNKKAQGRNARRLAA